MGLSSALQSELVDALGSQNVLMSVEALEKASRDETHGLAPRMPSAVLFPLSHEAVVQIAEICSRHETPMTPRGAGTGKSGGCVPVQGGVVIDFSKLNRVLALNQADFTVVVEPGVLLGELQRQVEAQGLYYPPDPASLEWCTLGGNVAENAGGPSAVKYGVTKDYVLGLRIVLADGRHFRIGKNTIKGVTGFDLVSLMCGSEGMLAFVTEITLRLLTKPLFKQAALYCFSSRQAAIEAVVKVRRSQAQPRCIEFLDALSIEALVRIGLRDPPAGTKSLLLVEVDGSQQEALLDSLSEVDAALIGEGYLGAVVAKDEREHEELWNLRRKLSEATKKLAKSKVSEDVVVPLSRMNAFLDDVDVIAARQAVRICVFGHAGDGNLHVQILLDDPAMKEQVPVILRELFAKTIQHAGSLTGEHGVGIAKHAYLPLEQEPGLIELQRQIKAVFDPRGLLNPGKFL
jgi:glycolate oxidase